MKITILGAGKQGTNIAIALLPGGHDITVIDNDAALIDKLSSRLDIRCINADAEDIASLKTAKIQNSDVLVACTDSDDKNMFLCSIAKELGVRKCIARVRSVDQFDYIDLIKKSMKIDLILNPDFACAGEIYKNLTQQSSFAEGYQMINGIAVLECTSKALPNIIGKQLKNCAGELGGLLVTAISRDGKILIPNGDTKFEENDDIFLVGKRDDILKMRNIVRSSKPSGHIQRVIIAGGGKTAFFLAKQLLASGIKVKIIENDRDRAEYLAVNLEKAMVVYGDASDSDLLFEEDIDSADAFVSCTGFDEENFMLALYAKQKGVKNVIAKMTRRNYSQMVEQIGEVLTINPVELCTANVIKILKEDENILFSKVIQGQAEFMELNIQSSMPICGKKIMNLNIPDGIIIAAVFRDGELLVPRGNTLLEKNDRILVFYLLSKMAELQKLLKNEDDNL